jgi:hypothetical protein
MVLVCTPDCRPCFLRARAWRCDREKRWAAHCVLVVSWLLLMGEDGRGYGRR